MSPTHRGKIDPFYERRENFYDFRAFSGENLSAPLPSKLGTATATHKKLPKGPKIHRSFLLTKETGQIWDFLENRMITI